MLDIDFNGWQRSYSSSTNKNSETESGNQINYINPGYGLSLVDTVWIASSYRQPLEQEGNPMT